MAAFLQHLFLFQFVCAWNKHQANLNFLDQQPEEMKQFNASQTPTPPIPIPRSTLTPASLPPTPAPAPQPKSSHSAPSHPPPVHIVEPPTQGDSLAPATRPQLSPSHLEWDDSQPVQVKPQKVEVVIPLSPKFWAIEESDKYQPLSSPAPPSASKTGQTQQVVSPSHQHPCLHVSL